MDIVQADWDNTIDEPDIVAEVIAKKRNGERFVSCPVANCIQEHKRPEVSSSGDNARRGAHRPGHPPVDFAERDRVLLCAFRLFHPFEIRYSGAFRQKMYFIVN